jgi:hypothetical protein
LTLQPPSVKIKSSAKTAAPIFFIANTSAYVLIQTGQPRPVFYFTILRAQPQQSIPCLPERTRPKMTLP